MIFVQELLPFVQMLMDHLLDASLVFSLGVMVGLGLALIVVTSPPKVRLLRVRVR